MARICNYEGVYGRDGISTAGGRGAGGFASAAEGADFAADFNARALTIEFEEPPAKFVVSPNSPVRQLWISAHSRSFKLGWDEGKTAFVLSETGQTLIEVARTAIVQQLGEEIARNLQPT